MLLGAAILALNAQPIDEDIEKAEHARLPSGLVVQVAHADKGPEQVFRADVVADLSGRDRPLQQAANGQRQSIEGMREELGVLVGSESERRRHALLGGDKVDVGTHPVAERLDGFCLVLQFVGQIRQLLHLAAVDGLEQGLARGEVAVECPDTDTGQSGDGLKACLRAAGAEDGFGGLQHPLAVADGVDARFPRGLLYGRFAAGWHGPPLEKRRMPPYLPVATLTQGILPSSVDTHQGTQTVAGRKPPLRQSLYLNELKSRTQPAAISPSPDSTSMGNSITLTVNGDTRTIALDDPRVTLLDLLRERLELTGTKKGCDRGQCGACTIIVDGRRINSCLALAVSHDGADILTIEGVARGRELHPVQEAFIAHDGLQCGFCTPGQIMSAIGLIEEGQAGDDPERVREGMSGNLCRCAAYQGITEAVLEAQKVIAAASRKEVA